MKGAIFNLLEDFIVEGWGVERFEKILGQCPFHTQIAHVGPGTYPDGNLHDILNQTKAERGIGTEEALRRFGRFAFPRLAGMSRRYLCPFFGGLVEGRGDYFSVPISGAETACTLEGAPSCEFSLHFPT